MAGDQIPLEARIIHAAEVYDAATTPRPHQERIAPAEAETRAREPAGTALDAAVVEALAAAVGRRQTLEFLRTDVRLPEQIEELEPDVETDDAT